LNVLDVMRKTAHQAVTPSHVVDQVSSGDYFRETF